MRSLLRYGQYGSRNNHGVPHIVANVLYPPLSLAAQGRLMCLGHGHNLVRQIYSLLGHRLFDQLNAADILGKLYFQGPTFVSQNTEQVVSYFVLGSFSNSILRRDLFRDAMEKLSHGYAL